MFGIKLFNKKPVEAEGVTKKENFPLKSITISKKFKRTLPNSWKIIRQYDSYRSRGGFDNRIIINRNMRLLDGYTQYLIAKMLGLETVTVYMKAD